MAGSCYGEMPQETPEVLPLRVRESDRECADRGATSPDTSCKDMKQ